MELLLWFAHRTKRGIILLLVENFVWGKRCVRKKIAKFKKRCRKRLTIVVIMIYNVDVRATGGRLPKCHHLTKRTYTPSVCRLTNYLIGLSSFRYNFTAISPKKFRCSLLGKLPCWGNSLQVFLMCISFPVLAPTIWSCKRVVTFQLLSFPQKWWYTG